MGRSADEREKQLAQLKQEATKRGFDRHALLLKQVSELPAELQSPDLMPLTSSGDIQTVIIFPPQIHRGWNYVPKQALLFTPAGAIHLLASIWPDQEPRITYLDGRGLMYLRATLLLLYGFLEVVGQGNDSPTHLGMEFNTVAWCYLSAPLRRLLRMSIAATDAPRDKITQSPATLKALGKLPLKFSNGVKYYGLLPGEQLEEFVFQPGLWKRHLLLFRRPVLANTLLLLTTHYVAIIQEELEVSQGWIVSYIPRDCITEIQSRPCVPWSELTFQLAREGQTAEYRLLLRDEAIEAWQMRWLKHAGQWKNL